MNAFDSLAKLLGIPTHQAEDVLHSERAARLTLSRRGFMGAMGGLAAAGAAFSFAPRRPDATLLLIADGQVVQRWYKRDRVYQWSLPQGVTTYELRRSGGSVLERGVKHPDARLSWVAYDAFATIIA